MGSDKDEDEHGCGDTLYKHGCGDSFGNPVEIDNDIHNKQTLAVIETKASLLCCWSVRSPNIAISLIHHDRKKSFCGEPGSRQISPVGGILKPSGEALKTR